MANPEPIQTSELPSVNAIAANDAIVIVANPDSPLPDRKTAIISLTNFANSITEFAKIPVSETPGSNDVSASAGSIFTDGNFLYIAVEEDYLKRVALEDF